MQRFYCNRQYIVHHKENKMSVLEEKSKFEDEKNAQEWYDQGLNFYEGKGEQQDFVEAEECFKKAVESTDHVKEASYYLGKIAEQNGDMNSAQGAIHWYKQSAEQGYDEAQYCLGNIFEKKGKKDNQKNLEAVKWYKKAATQNNHNAQYKLALLYAEYKKIGNKPADREELGLPSYKIAYEKAFGWLMMSASAERLSPEERKLRKSKLEAYRSDSWWTSSTYRLRGIISDWHTISNQNKQGSQDKGDGSREYNFANYYENSVAFEKCDAAALYWYKKSAEKNYGPAKAKLRELFENNNQAVQVNLGSEENYKQGEYYYYGNGLQKNYKLAESYYKKSADLGHIGAQYKLGFLYYKHYDIFESEENPGKTLTKKQGYKKAAEWLKKAATSGHADAQYLYGLLCQKYYIEAGLPNSWKIANEKAYGWFLAAKLSGHKKGSDKERSYSYASWSVHITYRLRGLIAHYRDPKSGEKKGKSEYYLGCAYAYGLVFDQSKSTALHFFKASEKKGYKPATVKIKELEESRKAVRQAELPENKNLSINTTPQLVNSSDSQTELEVKSKRDVPKKTGNKQQVYQHLPKKNVKEKKESWVEDIINVVLKKHAKMAGIRRKKNVTEERIKKLKLQVKLESVLQSGKLKKYLKLFGEDDKLKQKFVEKIAFMVNEQKEFDENNTSDLLRLNLEGVCLNYKFSNDKFFNNFNEKEKLEKECFKIALKLWNGLSLDGKFEKKDAVVLNFYKPILQGFQSLSFSNTESFFVPFERRLMDAVSKEKNVLKEKSPTSEDAKNFYNKIFSLSYQKLYELLQAEEMNGRFVVDELDYPNNKVMQEKQQSFFKRVC